MSAGLPVNSFHRVAESKPPHDFLQFHHANPPWHAALPVPIAVCDSMARGVVIPAEGGVAKIADPGVVYLTGVGSLKMTDRDRLQCRFTGAEHGG